jgi:succinate dehydrogenase/fumarate reductase flavoprotein subunit
MDADYDVIVAGGGLTGTVAAQAISHYSKQNSGDVSWSKIKFWLDVR